MEPDVRSHQDDATKRRRLRWRARRGLLENDLVLERFFARYESALTDEDVSGLDLLLDCSDNELLELILGRKDLLGQAATPQAIAVLEKLRGV
jgi:antitoxin CptB